MLWSVLSTAVAALFPIAMIPNLVRVVRHRTADGLTVQLSLIDLSTCSVWLAVAAGVGQGVYVTLAASVALIFVQFLLVHRYSGTPRWIPVVGIALMLVAFGFASAWPWIAVLVVAPLDMLWSGRSLRDIARSRAAFAVSVWSWVMWVAAYSAWVVEAPLTGNAILAAHFGALVVGSAIAAAATVTAHRRAMPSSGGALLPAVS